jgi:hypothetical protein
MAQGLPPPIHSSPIVRRHHRHDHSVSGRSGQACFKRLAYGSACPHPMRSPSQKEESPSQREGVPIVRCTSPYRGDCTYVRYGRMSTNSSRTYVRTMSHESTLLSGWSLSDLAGTEPRYGATSVPVEGQDQPDASTMRITHGVLGCSSSHRPTRTWSPLLDRSQRARSCHCKVNPRSDAVQRG